MPVTQLSQFKRWSSFVMGFFLNGRPIGSGCLGKPGRYLRKKLKVVLQCALQTEDVRLEKSYRNKGHGIHLYKALIETARSIGAIRIYSSATLNDKSRRMWAEKLPRIYKVNVIHTRRPCYSCGNRTTRIEGYYIDFTEKGNEPKSI
jgi:GNAT superfamily N-acetyltransferase